MGRGANRVALVVGWVRAVEVGRLRWRLEWRDPIAGARLRIRVAMGSVEELEGLLVSVNRALCRLHEGDEAAVSPESLVVPWALCKGRFLGEVARGPLSIGDALSTAIERSSGQDAHKAVLKSNARQFVGWLEGVFPGVELWEELSRDVVAQYMDSCRDLSEETIKHRLKPVRLAARYWAAERPGVFVDFTVGVRAPAGRARRDAAPLEALELLRFFAFVWERERAFYPVYLFAGGAGLRITEAAALRWCDVDVEARQVRVVSTAAHRVKTRASERVLPVADWVVSRYRAWLAEQVVQGIGEEPIVGQVMGPAELNNVWRRLQRHGWVPSAGFTPSELRATFATLVERAGVDRDTLARYVGHAAKSVLAQRYLPAPELQIVADTANSVLQNAGTIMARSTAGA